MDGKKKNPRGSEFWQIIFPTLLGAVMILVVGIWFGIAGSSGNVARFAEVSTVLLVFPLALITLLFGIILLGLIYLVGRMIQGIPPITGRILEFLGKIREGAKSGTRSVARLVIEPAALMAVFQPKRNRQKANISLND